MKRIRVDETEILVNSRGEGYGGLTAVRDAGDLLITSGKLVQREVNDLLVLTLARGDEKTAQFIRGRINCAGRYGKIY